MSSSPHLSRKQATEAFMEITGLDATASSLNEVMRANSHISLGELILLK